MQVNVTQTTTTCTWNCVACTYENTFEELKCTICESQRPPNVTPPNKAASFERVASADLQYLNLIDPPPPPVPSWKRGSVPLAGMGNQNGMDAFQGLRPAGSSDPLNVPLHVPPRQASGVATMAPAGTNDQNNGGAQAQAVKITSLADSGFEMLLNSLGIMVNVWVYRHSVS
jgi:hypothetical protein